jgi:N-acetylglucosamine-6-phosphate deacetylase
MVSEIAGSILTPGGFVRGTLELRDSRIVRVRGDSATEQDVLARGEPIVLPGFIDSHVHGGGGYDTMQGGDALERIARMHVRHGTTSLLATTVTSPLAELESAMRGFGPVCRRRPRAAARVLGVHLEGPYINAGKLGAQPDFVRPASVAEVLALHALAPIVLITLAPELPGHLDAIPKLLAAGFRVQVGHTLGSYEDGVAALERGAGGFTHLFNAMSGMHHRTPGIVGAALAHARYAEIIPDLLHVHAGALKVALRAIPGLFCVTDSTAAAGMPDGEYRLGPHRVTKCLGGVRLADGTLAGSTLTMEQALANLVKLGLSLREASLRVSTHAADYLGLAERGRVAEGAWADLVVVDRELELKRVVVEGEEIDLADA